MSKILFVIANKYTNQSYLAELVQSNLQSNDCTIWTNTPLSEDLLEIKVNVLGPGLGKKYSYKNKVKSSGFTRLLIYPFLILKVFHKMLLSPLTCAWKLNHTKYKVNDSSFEIIMAADAQAILSIWVFGKKYSSPQLLSVKKVIS